AASALQLRDPARRAKPPAALGPEASGRPRLEVRVTGSTATEPWALPERGRIGIAGLILAESAVFGIFVAAYIYYIGKSQSGPTPAQVLHLPILVSILLWSSSVTVHLAVGALRGGRVQTFTLWWFLTILLGALFLIGTGAEWHRLIYQVGLTIRTNLFGTTFYSLVGL